MELAKLQEFNIGDMEPMADLSNTYECIQSYTEQQPLGETKCLLFVNVCNCSLNRHYTPTLRCLGNALSWNIRPYCCKSIMNNGFTYCNMSLALYNFFIATWLASSPFNPFHTGGGGATPQKVFLDNLQSWGNDQKIVQSSIFLCFNKILRFEEGYYRSEICD